MDSTRLNETRKYTSSIHTHILYNTEIEAKIKPIMLNNKAQDLSLRNKKTWKTKRKKMTYLAKFYGVDEMKNEPSNKSEMEEIKDLVFVIQGK